MRQIAFPWSHIKSKPDSTTQLSNIACYNSNRMKQKHNKNDDVTNIVVNRRSMQMRFPGRTTTASHSLHFILLSTQHKAAVGALFPVIWHQGAKKKKKIILCQTWTKQSHSIYTLDMLNFTRTDREHEWEQFKQQN